MLGKILHAAAEVARQRAHRHLVIGPRLQVIDPVVCHRAQPRRDGAAGKRARKERSQLVIAFDRHVPRASDQLGDAGGVHDLIAKPLLGINEDALPGERLAINSVVQGSAADLIKLAMVNVQRRIDHRFCMVVVANEEIHLADNLLDVGRILPKQDARSDALRDDAADRIGNLAMIESRGIAGIGDANEAVVGMDFEDDLIDPVDIGRRDNDRLDQRLFYR